MIVVEDTEASEIRSFVAVDASVQLGHIEVGDYRRIFDPERTLTYYEMVEDQLHDFSSKYSAAFRYIPRRAYDYLKKPPILSELFQSSFETTQQNWFVDFFLARPLVSVVSRHLPGPQRRRNTELSRLWSLKPPYSSRFYYVQDISNSQKGDTGWACMLRPDGIEESLDGRTRTDLIDYIQQELPIVVELDNSEDMDLLLRWLIFLKESKLPSPKLILSLRKHRSWGKKITKLLDIPNSRILTAGGTISTISTLINHLKESSEDDSWSKRIVFASSFPETKSGDSISEILSFLLSKSLSASAVEIQRVLGGNILSMLPPRPPFLRYNDCDSAVVAEGKLGSSSMSGLSRILQVLRAKGLKEVVSIDYMTSSKGGKIELNSVVLTMKEPKTPIATSCGILVERNGTLRVSGWKKSFEESLGQRRADLLPTLIRSSTHSDGPILDSPAHIFRFNQAVIDCFQVSRPQEILSALHYTMLVDDIEAQSIIISPNDMRALRVSEDDSVVVMDGITGQWWWCKVESDDNVRRKTITVSRNDSKILRLPESSNVDIFKYEDEVLELESATFSYESEAMTSGIELSSYVYLHEDDILDVLRKRKVGKGMRIWYGEEDSDISLSLVRSTPQLVSGQVGKIPKESLMLKPAQFFREFNVILCIVNSESMNTRDIELKAKYSVMRRLSTLSETVPEIREFAEGLGRNISRVEMAGLVALLVIDALRVNWTEGKLGVVTVGSETTKFSIQKGERYQPYVEFAQDLISEEVLVSLAYTILDVIEENAGKANLLGAYRSIAELLEDFGQERPTIVILLSDTVRGSENPEPFLKAIALQDRYLFDLIGVGKEFDHVEAKNLLDGINSRIFPLNTIAAKTIEGYFMSTVEQILPRSKKTVHSEGSR